MYVADDSGYQVQEGDLVFLSITAGEMTAMMDHRVPLGMNEQEFDWFCETLNAAAQRDGIDDLDARLQGSAARFFAGSHKKMAFETKQVVEDFERERGRLPEPLELRQICERLQGRWPDPANRPLRRPFDAYYRLGIARERSDYDVQISSDTVARLAAEKLDLLGLDEEYETRHPTYRFIKKSLVYAIAPNLSNWAVLQTDVLRRSVTIAAFPGSGPEVSEDAPEKSSHHRPSDWVLGKGRS